MGLLKNGGNSSEFCNLAYKKDTGKIYPHILLDAFWLLLFYILKHIHSGDFALEIH